MIMGVLDHIFTKHDMIIQGRTQGGVGGVDTPPLRGFRGGYNPPPLPLIKISNKTKIRLNESKNISLDIFPYH